MLTEILTVAGSVVGSGAISAFLTSVIYRKQNKKLKDDEVQKAKTDTDKQQIDLGDMFLEKTIKWGEMIEQNTEKMVNRMVEKLDENNAKRDEDWDKLKKDMELLKTDTGEIKNEQKIVTAYLNGGYEAFRESWKKKTT